MRRAFISRSFRAERARDATGHALPALLRECWRQSASSARLHFQSTCRRPTGAYTHYLLTVNRGSAVGAGALRCGGTALYCLLGLGRCASVEDGR